MITFLAAHAHYDEDSDPLSARKCTTCTKHSEFWITCKIFLPAFGLINHYSLVKPHHTWYSCYTVRFCHLKIFKKRKNVLYLEYLPFKIPYYYWYNYLNNVMLTTLTALFKKYFLFCVFFLTLTCGHFQTTLIDLTYGRSSDFIKQGYASSSGQTKYSERLKFMYMYVRLFWIFHLKLLLIYHL